MYAPPESNSGPNKVGVNPLPSLSRAEEERVDRELAGLQRS